MSFPVFISKLTEDSDKQTLSQQGEMGPVGTGSWEGGPEV